MKVFWNLVKNDIKTNRIMTTVLIIFLLLSAVLMASGLRVTGIMLSSTSALNQIATPPDFFQMHKGEIDRVEIQKFAESHSYIKKYQIVSMLNIANINLFYQGETLENCLMDNGFVVQSIGFDYLLNMNNEIANVNNGEVGVPVYYSEELGIQVGDKIIIKDGTFEKELTVVTLIRDSQMNVPLTSSKRFLISETDQREISKNTGEWEYSIEYIVKPGTAVSALENDYISEGMPSNGVAIQKGLLDVLNSLSYGLTAILLLLISFILIFIALLCLSYVIRATLAEEHSTIGTMKAIGFQRSAINQLYQAKYTVLATIAGIVGYILAIPIGTMCGTSVVLYCGSGKTNWIEWVLPFAGIVLLESQVILQCKRMIQKNLKSTVVELLRDEENVKKEGNYHLPKHRMIWKNFTIALGELACKWKEYFVLYLVFVFAAFLIILPINMQQTIQDPSFITYMGIGKCDIRIDIQKGDKLESQKEDLIQELINDSEVSDYVVFQNGYVQILNPDGEWEYLRVSSGNESTFPIQYVEGKSPDLASSAREIALSYMEVSELGLKVGDTIQLKQNESITEYILTGIYQDVTYSGKTGKAPITFTNDSIEGYVFYLKLEAGVSIGEKVKELRQITDVGRVTPISEFIQQTLGGIIGNVKTVIVITTILSILLIILITTMFLQLITAKEHSEIAVKKSLGFTNGDIRMQLGIRVFIIQLLAIITGTVLAKTLGETLFSMFLSSFGATRIYLLENPFVSDLLCPVCQIIICLVTIVFATNVVKRYQIREQIME